LIGFPRLLGAAACGRLLPGRGALALLCQPGLVLHFR
jgi:hypothetical protein